MKKKVQEFCTFFMLQLVGYLLITINYRAIAEANYGLTAGSDFAFASLSFFVIRKIAKSEEQVHQWAGYATGSVVGSLLGIYISKHWMGV
jgi:hypothetical protein